MFIFHWTFCYFKHCFSVYWITVTSSSRFIVSYFQFWFSQSRSTTLEIQFYFLVFKYPCCGRWAADIYCRRSKIHGINLYLGFVFSYFSAPVTHTRTPARARVCVCAHMRGCVYERKARIRHSVLRIVCVRSCFCTCVTVNEKKKWEENGQTLCQLTDNENTSQWGTYVRARCRVFFV